MKTLNQKYNLFLDDIRIPSAVGNYINPVELRSQYRLEDWIIVRNYNEFIACVREMGLPIKVSFDHDLAVVHYDPETWIEGFEYDEETGLDCVKWLCNYCTETEQRLPECFFHSMNPVGRENMIRYIEGFKNANNETQDNNIGRT